MNVTTIPKKTITVITPTKKRVDKAKYDQLRVAAYCRVSTDSEEQLTSYTIQKRVYTEMIMEKPELCLVDIYADATDIIGLKQNPTNGRRFSPIFFVYRAFST